MPASSSLSRRLFLTATSAWALSSAASSAVQLPAPDRGGVPPNKLYDYGSMGPPATPEIVTSAIKGLKTPPAKGPVKPEWSSLEANYRTPAWFGDLKFGIFIHWGLYSVAARRNEWYQKHMYGRAESDWHAANFGPHERFGYKDFIPLFKAEKFNPEAWADLFAATGARFVIPAAQHHDNFALWDSKVTRFNSKAMGPKRDLIGELATSVRKRGLKYGLANHGVENFTFINPIKEIDDKLKALKADLYDPNWADFYNVADRSPAAMSRFLTDWTERNYELIDKYQPDILWFDNGANLRVLDPLKLRVAAYYYNRAKTWGKEVTLSSKFVCYAPSNDDTKQIGSIIDFEKVGARSPADIRPGPWIVDDNLASTWGYTEGMTVASADNILRRLIDTVSKGGTYLMNISPKGDGSVPDSQQETMRTLGKWLSINGEAIFGTTPWRTFGEGDIRFTHKNGDVYAITTRPTSTVSLKALSSAAGHIAAIKQVDTQTSVPFIQTVESLQFEPQASSGFAAYEIRFA